MSEKKPREYSPSLEEEEGGTTFNGGRATEVLCTDGDVFGQEEGHDVCFNQAGSVSISLYFVRRRKTLKLCAIFRLEYLLQGHFS